MSDESCCCYLNILKSSSISESPGKRGLFVVISARMVPTAHISTGSAYVLQPRRISGGRYHRVTTCEMLRYVVVLRCVEDRLSRYHGIRITIQRGHLFTRYHASSNH